MFLTVSHRKRPFAVVVKRMKTFKKPPKLPFEIVEYILVLMADIAIRSARGRGSQIACFEALCEAYPRYVSWKTFKKYRVWVPTKPCCSSCGFSYNSYGFELDSAYYYDDTAPLETPIGWWQRHPDEPTESRYKKNQRPQRFRRPRVTRRKNKDRVMRDVFE